MRHLLGILCIIIAASFVLAFILLLLISPLENMACERHGGIVGKPAKYDMWTGVCYLQTNGKWHSKNIIRVEDGK